MEMFIGFHKLSGQNTLLIILLVGTIFCEATSTFLCQYAYQKTCQNSHVCLCVVYLNFDVLFLLDCREVFFKKSNTLGN
jgi:hypothetical protein